MNLKIIHKFIFTISLSLISYTAHSSVIECDKLNFKGGVFAYFDMEDDNIEEVRGSRIFQGLTDGVIFNTSEDLARVQFLEEVEYQVSDIKYEVSENSESQRCQIKFDFSVTDNVSQQSRQVSEYYELIALSHEGIYWFGQRDTVYSEAYFYLEKVN